MDPPVVEALRQAKTLYDEGMLTIDEFTHQKSIILEGKTNSNGIEDSNEVQQHEREFQHERGASAACGLFDASCQASSDVSSIHVNTHMIAVAESKQLRHKRKADLRKESRRNLNALVARLDAVSLYGLLYG
jgi:hypothetical protein